jgi:putative ABC transport system ATP-binding protein
MSKTLLQTVGLCRYYRSGTHEVRAIDGVDLTIEQGEFIGIVGASGSGKSTILNLMAGLDTPTSGHIEVDGTSLSSLSRRDLAAYRARKVGMVFQSFNLITHHTALKNVEMALYFNEISKKERRRRATETLEQLGLGDRVTHKPNDLSGGEQQRVAMARAIVKRPEILFADEPTGNLDQENTNQISRILTELNKQGLTIILVTHDLDLAREYSHRTVRMNYGRIVNEHDQPSAEGEKS